MLTDREIFENVREILCYELSREPEEVVPTTLLSGDLGAESIDFLAITYRLERQFGLKIPRNEMFPEPFEGDFTVDVIVKYIQGRLKKIHDAPSSGVACHT